MQIHPIHCGTLRVRANEMIKPLSVQQVGAHYDVDSEGYMRLAINSLLVREGDQVVLIDPGVADFLPSRILQEYGMVNMVHIEEELAKIGCTADRITDVIFTHLHFDHGSGAFKRLPGQIVKRFPNAGYHVLKAHFNYATRSHVKTSSSYFTTLLQRIGTIHWLEDWKNDFIEFMIFNGHTKGMAVPVIRTPGEVTYFLTDLIPMEIFLNQEVYSGYDLDQNLAMKEKTDFMKNIREKSSFLFFHDPLKNNLIYP